MIVDCRASDIIFTPHINHKERPKAWSRIWSAGHGVGNIVDVPPVATIVARLKDEYDAALADMRAQAAAA